ncbi:large ribosomal subunit protein uL22 [Blattabacterium cuenoti]|uniref:large ribosomal subunit protein uL22 n=1 Tax=Blattabacterium cuenoti TaxID=1653831 RepID=UPI00163C9F72|nr:uL22 family ribosomal protein [Blattabacterium cuenoti]
MKKNNEKKEKIAVASLNGLKNSPRKMQLIANLIRYRKVKEALFILSNSRKKGSIDIKKLLISLLANWNKKYENKNSYYYSPLSVDDSLFLKNVIINQGKTLKRMKPVPQGRGHKIRKRSSNIKIFIVKKEKINYGTKNKSYS